jgi:hypothetical protein
MSALRQSSGSPGASSVATVVEVTQTRRSTPWALMARAMHAMPSEYTVILPKL